MSLTILFLIVIYAVSVIARDKIIFLSQAQQVQTLVYQANSENTTLQIDSDNTFLYYLVSLDTIKPKHSEVVLLFAYKNPPQFEGDQLNYQGIDFDGFVQQTGNHFLRIPVTQNTVYVTVKANRSIHFQITVKGSSLEECMNDCSFQGQCLSGECNCDEGFIGRDCGTKAIQLFDDTPLQETTQNDVTYFYYENSRQKKKQQIAIQTDSFENLLVGITYPSILSLPTKNYSEILVSINQNQNLVLKFSPMKHQKKQEDDVCIIDQSQLMIAVWGSQNQNLYITINSIPGEQDKLSIAIIVVAAVGGLIGLIFIIFLIYLGIRKLKNKLTKNKYSVDNCTVCFKKFSDGSQIKSLTCGHPFHEECINKWLEIKNNCPLCKLKIETNQI